MKLDNVTSAVLVAGLFTVINVLAILCFWLFRRNQLIQTDRVKGAELQATKAEIRSNTVEQNMLAVRDQFKTALQVERLKGRQDAYEGLLKSFAGEMIRHSKDYALGQVRREMHDAIRQEIEVQGKNKTPKAQDEVQDDEQES